MKCILITGGTGLIGKRLTEMLIETGHRVIILTRHPDRKKTTGNISYAGWDMERQQIDPAAIQAADHIIHLAGENVMGKRWTDARKQEIVESRTHTSELLVKAVSEIPNKVRTIISASAIGWYGADTAESLQHGFREVAAADNQFLGETCRRWEASIAPVMQQGKRLVILRTGIVLSSSGGALKEFKKPMRFGLAAIMGTGRQMVSWIHIDDLCRLYMEAIGNESMTGVYNAVAPNPVSNKQLVLTLAEQLLGKYLLPIHIPVFVLKLALGEMSIEVLKSTTVSAQKTVSTGFYFRYPGIEEALRISLSKL